MMREREENLKDDTNLCQIIFHFLLFKNKINMSLKLLIVSKSALDKQLQLKTRTNI